MRRAESVAHGAGIECRGGLGEHPGAGAGKDDPRCTGGAPARCLSVRGLYRWLLYPAGAGAVTVGPEKRACSRSAENLVMKIYTKKGDKGMTGLFGGSRVYKDDARVDCYGTLDEVNSTIGLLRAKLGTEHPWQPRLHRIQKDMMDMMSHLARPSDCKKENTNPHPLDGAEFCEKWIDELEAGLTTASEYFLLPGGNEISALCHVVRTQM